MSLLFLSHSAADADLAAFVEEQIRRLVPNCEVFRTSRTGQILPGDEWFREITDKLKKASSYLILVTPNSVSRPWMWFEAGAGWMSERPIVPVTAAIAKENVPDPLRFFQIYSLERDVEAHAVFAKLGGQLPDPAMFASAVMQISKRIREQVDADSGWEGIGFDPYFVAWDGPLQELPEAHDIPTPDGLIAALNDRGMHQQYVVRSDPTAAHFQGYRQVWAVDQKRKRKHALITQHGQVLFTRPHSDRPGG